MLFLLPNALNFVIKEKKKDLYSFSKQFRYMLQFVILEDTVFFEWPIILHVFRYSKNHYWDKTSINVLLISLSYLVYHLRLLLKTNL